MRRLPAATRSRLRGEKRNERDTIDGDSRKWPGRGCGAGGGHWLFRARVFCCPGRQSSRSRSMDELFKSHGAAVGSDDVRGRRVAGSMGDSASTLAGTRRAICPCWLGRAGVVGAGNSANVSAICRFVLMQRETIERRRVLPIAKDAAKKSAEAFGAPAPGVGANLQIYCHAAVVKSV